MNAIGVKVLSLLIQVVVDLLRNKLKERSKRERLDREKNNPTCTVPNCRYAQAAELLEEVRGEITPAEVKKAAKK